MIRDRWLLLSRLAVVSVLVWHLSAAIPFTLHPETFITSFGVEGCGVGGTVMVRGLGVAFLMWQIPYLPVIWHPARQKTCFGCVLGMQVVGLLGELLMLIDLPSGNPALLATGWRFVFFDGTGLLLLGFAYTGLLLKRQKLDDPFSV
ncbi:MAG: hypothetical protein JXA42_21330 [Anaerolineales bacterium]|nr:hypothetical protein [Anaerolineales bacterium]